MQFSGKYVVGLFLTYAGAHCRACYVTEPRWSPPQRLFDLDTHHSLQVIPFETRLYARHIAFLRISGFLLLSSAWLTGK